MNWKLEPCPFCGARANDDDQPLTLGYLYELETYAVNCDRCGASGGMSELRDEAVWLWNRRAT